MWLVGFGGKRQIMAHFHIGTDHRQPKPLANEGGRCPEIIILAIIILVGLIYIPCQAGRHRQLLQAQVRGGMGVRFGIKSKQPDIVGYHNGIFTCQQTGSMRLRIFKPACTSLAFIGVSEIFDKYHQCGMVMANSALVM